MPRITRPQVHRVVREMSPRERFGPDDLLQWLVNTQDSNEKKAQRFRVVPECKFRVL